jgi:hypothetical protein
MSTTKILAITPPVANPDKLDALSRAGGPGDEANAGLA